MLVFVQKSLHVLFVKTWLFAFEVFYCRINRKSFSKLYRATFIITLLDFGKMLGTRPVCTESRSKRAS